MKKPFSKIVLPLLGSILLLSSCSKSSTILKVKGSGAYPRALIEVENVSNHIKLPTHHYYEVSSESGEVLVSQLASDGTLLIKPDEKYSGEAQYKISVTKDKPNFKQEVEGRLYPERYDDFAFENNKVGFRMYGAALKSYQSASSGIDLFYKRTSSIVLEDWYRKDISGEASYHVDHGEGCDPYTVAQTFGAGAMGILVDSVLIFNENFISSHVNDNGPLRISFTLKYPTLKINDNNVDEERTIQLDAGSQLLKIDQRFSGLQDNVTVEAGFAKRTYDTDSILYSAPNNYFVYEEPPLKNNGQIYLGLIMPTGIDCVLVQKISKVGNSDKILVNMPNVVATTKLNKAGSLIYYAGFGWNKSEFEDAEAFNDYIQKYSENIKNNGYVISFK